MSEEFPAMPAESAVVTPASELGTVLRATREALGMDIEEVARKLCLSSRQLIALEADDFHALPSPAFTRGFIRNYARLLNLEVNPLLERYREALPLGMEGAAISLHTEGIPILTKDKKSWMLYLLASVIVGVGAGAWMVYMDWSEKPVVPAVASIATKPAAPVPAGEPAPALAVPAMQPDSEAPSMALPPEPAAIEQKTSPEVAPTLAVAPMLTLPKGQLTMVFTEQSWMRVTDKNGVEIFNKTKAAGSEDVAEGQPPFKVDIGNAAGVQLRYNGQLVELTPHAKANVARLTLE